jgi:hypothetical protein
MPNRVFMNFHSGRSYNGPIYANLSTINAPPAPVRSAALNAPMIDRVHKAKPGCSACGKKVA